jgi:small subunit ribosomal protein S20
MPKGSLSWTAERTAKKSQYTRARPVNNDAAPVTIAKLDSVPDTLVSSSGSFGLWTPTEEGMPHHKSAAKRVITNEKARVRNIAARSRMRSAIRAVRAATKRAEAETAYQQAVSILDRTVAKGVIKRETASRHKSRLAKFAHSRPA